MQGIPLFPAQASTTAHQVDTLFIALLVMTFLIAGVIFVLVGFFAIRYRKGSSASRKNAQSDNLPMELTWLIIPLFISFGIYIWATKLFADMRVVPAGATEIYVVGKQWMWKIQHEQGNREINELHVPVGRPIKLIMTSQDVIHSFYIPAFRIKQDVLPGRYTTEWFQATKVGEYQFFCAQYCGTSHASMIGRVIVMEPAQYAQWLAGGVSGESMATAGARVFQQYGCMTCHAANATGRGPSLVGLFGTQVALEGGSSVVADQNYIRESILNPTAKVVLGYKPIMPTFRNQLSPEQLSQVIEYVKSLGGPAVAAKGAKR